MVGTDIAHLLLEGHEPTTVDYRLSGMKIAASMDSLNNDEDAVPDVSTMSVTADRSVLNHHGKSVDEVTDRFRHLLLYGRKKVKSLLFILDICKLSGF